MCKQPPQYKIHKSHCFYLKSHHLKNPLLMARSRLTTANLLPSRHSRIASSASLVSLTITGLKQTFRPGTALSSITTAIKCFHGVFSSCGCDTGKMSSRQVGFSPFKLSRHLPTGSLRKLVNLPNLPKLWPGKLYLT